VRRATVVGLGAGAAVLSLAALAALGSLAGSGAGGGRRPAAVPTARVERVDFVRRVPAEGHLRAAEATALAVPAAAPGSLRIAWLAADGGRVEAGDPVARFDPTEMEEQLADARADLAAAEVKIAKERGQSATDLANLDRDAEVAALELDAARRFQKQDELIYSRAEIIESALDETLAGERRRHAEAARESRRALARDQLALLAVERRKARLKIDQAERALAALEVAAPKAGVVVLERDGRGNPPRVGDSVWPGQPLGEIPDPAALEAEVYVLEADAGGLAVGERAEVTVDARPERPLPATVAQVDAVAKPRVPGSPVQYFAVALRFDAGSAPGDLKPGQRVSAVLELDAVAAALVVPRQAVFDAGLDGGGGKRVFRREGGGFRPVEVALGPVAFGRAVVASGLAAGDVVALEDPTRRAGPAAPPPGEGAAPAAPLGGGGGPGGGP
jgi:hypothetical protein